MARSRRFIDVLRQFKHVAAELHCIMEKEADARGYGYPFSQAFDEVYQHIYDWHAAEEIGSGSEERLKEKLIA